MVDGQNIYVVYTNPVNDAVTAHDEFSDVFVRQFRKNPAQSWRVG